MKILRLHTHETIQTLGHTTTFKAEEYNIEYNSMGGFTINSIIKGANGVFTPMDNVREVVYQEDIPNLETIAAMQQADEIIKTKKAKK